MPQRGRCRYGDGGTRGQRRQEMATIPKVEQSIFGKGRDAREGYMEGHMPHMPNPYEGLSRDLQSFSRDMGNMFQGVVRLAKQGQELALMEASAAYDEEVAAALEKDVFSLRGSAASGATEKAGKILQAAEERQLGRLAAYGGGTMESFRIRAQRARAGQLGRVMRHEDGQVRDAAVAAGNRDMTNKALLYAQTGDSALLDEIGRSHDRTYLAKLGYGEAITLGDEELGNFVAGLDENMRKELETNRAWQYAKAVTGRIDALAKEGLIGDAQSLLEEYKDLLPEGAYATAKAQLGLLKEKQDAGVEASAYVTGLLAEGAKDPASLGGRIITDKMRMAAAEKQSILDAAGREDPTGKAQKVADDFRRKWATQWATSKAFEDAALGEALKSMSGLPRQQQEVLYAMMPGSRIKDKVGKVLATQWAAEEKRPDVKANQKALSNELLRHAVLGIPLRLPDHNEAIDLSTAEGLKTAMTAMGLTPTSQAEVVKYLQHPRARELPAFNRYVAEAVNEYCGLKGEKAYTATTLNSVAPELIGMIVEISQMFPEVDLKGKEGQERIREWTRGYIASQTATVDRSWWFGKKEISMKDVLIAGVTISADSVDQAKQGGDVDTMAEFLKKAKSERQAKDAEKYLQYLRREAFARRDGETEADMKSTRRYPGSIDKDVLKRRFIRVGEYLYSDAVAAVEAQRKRTDEAFRKVGAALDKTTQINGPFGMSYSADKPNLEDPAVKRAAEEHTAESRKLRELERWAKQSGRGR